METFNQYEYEYSDNQLGHHHAYLTQPLKTLLELDNLHLSAHQGKPRLLDTGCGNGSLSNWLANQGYSVVGVEDSLVSGKWDQHFTALWDGGHIKFFSPATLSALLEAEGYSDTRFQFAGRFPYLWKSMLCSSVLR